MAGAGLSHAAGVWNPIMGWVIARRNIVFGMAASLVCILPFKEAISVWERSFTVENPAGWHCPPAAARATQQVEPPRRPLAECGVSGGLCILGGEDGPSLKEWGAGREWSR